MTRLTSIATVVVSLALGSVAFAQSQAEIAAKLNDEGKELMYGGHIAEASAKFAEAVARVPEAKYFFNLCTSRVPGRQVRRGADRVQRRLQQQPDARAEGQGRQAGRPDQGRGEGAGHRSPAAAAAVATPTCASRIQTIRAACRRRLRTSARPPRTTRRVPRSRRSRPTPRRPRPWSAVRRRRAWSPATPPDNKYTWTLGVDLFGGGGKIGQDGRVRHVGQRLPRQGRLPAQPRDADRRAGLLPAHALRPGQAWTRSARRRSTSSTSASRPTSTCAGLEPAVLHAARRRPARADEPRRTTPTARAARCSTTRARGARLELGLQYALGSRYEHVLSVDGGANLYSAVFSDPSDGTSMHGRGVGPRQGWRGRLLRHRLHVPVQHAVRAARRSSRSSSAAATLFFTPRRVVTPADSGMVSRCICRRQETVRPRSDAKLVLPGGKEATLPVVVGTEDEHAIDIRSLRTETGYITLDSGYMNTGSTTSAITYLDGEQGILRYRGYSIEELAEHSDFVETSYLLINGKLPTKDERAEVLDDAHPAQPDPRGHAPVLRGLPADQPPDGGAVGDGHVAVGVLPGQPRSQLARSTSTSRASSRRSARSRRSPTRSRSASR